MSYFTITMLQAITVGIGFAIGYYFNKGSMRLWRLFIGFLVGFAGSWLAGVIIWTIVFRSNDPYAAIVSGMPKSFLFAIIGGGMGVYFGRRKAKLSATSPLPASPPANRISETRPTPIVQLPASLAQASLRAADADEALWAQAFAEFDSPRCRPGLWARSFSEAGGDEAVAKASYLGARVRELEAERQAALAAEERLAQEQVQHEKLAKLSEVERAYALLPKGKCPNCPTVQPLASTECPKCKAMFGQNSLWQLLPVAET